MKKLTELLAEIDTLKAELDKLKPFKREDEERLWKKFRLEWNYNSNHIEGNTLTYGQTELLLIFDKTTGDHDMREYEEMKAHDVAIKLVQEYAADKVRELTESDIRQLNEIILVRPYWGNAQTPDGQHTRKLIEPGVYKREPNSVRLQNGEMFHYASPEETPAKMKEMMEWYRAASNDNNLHPVYIAAKMHYDFVRIHPFDDSNGRTSRLLMNYVLLGSEFPPVIVKSADKRNYLNALNRADVGDFDAFVEYIIDQLKWSLNLKIKSIKGENIEESNDIDKEIEVWKKGLRQPNLSNVTKSKKIIEVLARHSVINIFLLFFDKHISAFNDLFTSNIQYIVIDGVSYVLQSRAEINGRIERHLRQYGNENNDNFLLNEQNWRIEIQFKNPKRIRTNNVLMVRSTLSLIFRLNNYEFRHNDSKIFSNEYQNLQLTTDETDFIVNESMKAIFQEIQYLFTDNE